ncbi:MAG: hypothetical protein J7K54_01340 [Candidatus Aenigmarchaeota archaeon]|nr:hypothetical protein [Candidatus Aenigmarchaeota archaeon]
MKLDMESLEFGALMFLSSLLIGNYIGGDSRRACDKPEPYRKVYISENAVSPDELPRRARKHLMMQDINHDGVMESFYVWTNPDGRDVSMPVIKNNYGEIRFPTISSESYTPLDVPKWCSSSTFFMDKDADGDLDALYLEYTGSHVLAVPLIKPPKEKEQRKVYKL